MPCTLCFGVFNWLDCEALGVRIKGVHFSNLWSADDVDVFSSDGDCFQQIMGDLGRESLWHLAAGRFGALYYEPLSTAMVSPSASRKRARGLRAAGSFRSLFFRVDRPLSSVV